MRIPYAAKGQDDKGEVFIGLAFSQFRNTFIPYR